MSDDRDERIREAVRQLIDEDEATVELLVWCVLASAAT